jgi:hypothetical protein
MRDGCRNDKAGAKSRLRPQILGKKPLGDSPASDYLERQKSFGACADAASRPDAEWHRMNTGKTARRPGEETTSIPVRKSQGGDLTVWSGCA